METNGQALVEFWAAIADSEKMNPNTAGSYKNACEAVLSRSPHWRESDVRKMDVDRLIARFREQPDPYSEHTVRTYEAVFRRAVPSFLDYVRDPGSWTPPVRKRYTGRPPSPDPNAVEQNQKSVSIPFLDGRTATLTLPHNLSLKDAEFLQGVIPMYLKQAIGGTSQ